MISVITDKSMTGTSDMTGTTNNMRDTTNNMRGTIDNMRVTKDNRIEVTDLIRIKDKLILTKIKIIKTTTKAKGIEGDKTTSEKIIKVHIDYIYYDINISQLLLQCYYFISLYSLV